MTEHADVYHLQFTEEIKGWFGAGEHDYRAGYEEGRKHNSSLMFHLTMVMDDVYRFMEDPRLFAPAHGWVHSHALGGRRTVEHGELNLFVDQAPRRKRMLYRLFFTDGEGRPTTLSGYKDIKGERISTVWPETTTLYTRLLRGHIDEEVEGGAEILGSGILRIGPLAFAQELSTFRVTGGSLSGNAKALGAFINLFIGHLWQVFIRWPRR